MSRYKANYEAVDNIISYIQKAIMNNNDLVVENIESVANRSDANSKVADGALAEVVELLMELGTFNLKTRKSSEDYRDLPLSIDALNTILSDSKTRIRIYPINGTYEVTVISGIY